MSALTRPAPPAGEIDLMMQRGAELREQLATSVARELDLLREVSEIESGTWDRTLRHVAAALDGVFRDSPAALLPGLAAARREVERLHGAPVPVAAHRIEITVDPRWDDPVYRLRCYAPLGAYCRSQCEGQAAGRCGDACYCPEPSLVDCGHCLAEEWIEAEAQHVAAYAGPSTSLRAGPVEVAWERGLQTWTWHYAGDGAVQ